jgi:signal transduction histidine kinase
MPWFPNGQVAGWRAAAGAARGIMPGMAEMHPVTRAPSLIRLLALIHAFVALVALVVGGIVLHHTLAGVVWRQHMRAVLASGEEVVARLEREGPAGLERPLSDEAQGRFDAATGSMRFTVRDRSGRVLAASPGAGQALPLGAPGAEPEMFRAGRDGSRLWGLTRPVATPEGEVTLQLAQDMDRSYVVLDDVPHAALGPVLLVLAGGAALLFGASAMLLAIMLRPLRRAAEQAGRIGAGESSGRLDGADIPLEVQPLLQAVNGALDRLDEALAWQRGFSEEVAHELRTPLAIMLAELDLAEPGPARDRLRQDVAGLVQLVTDLLEAAEAARVKPLGEDRFDLAELAADTAQRLAPVAERAGHAIALLAAPGPFWVRGDRDAVGRALRNLVENALAHSPAGQPVGLHLGAAAEGQVAIAVSDHGPGVPPRDRERIFHRAWRKGDTHRRGLGLGLSIVHRIVRAHAGTVAVGDAPGGGALFTMTLPVAVAPGRARPVAERALV